MADMELVIKIPEEMVQELKDGCFGAKHTLYDLAGAICDGIVLPKGHGRIGDLDALRCENTDFDTYNDYCTMFDEIEAAETIIDADELENEEA